VARSIRIRESFLTYDYSDIHPEEIWDVGGPAFDWCAFKVTPVLLAEAKRTAPGLPGTSHARFVRAGTGNLRNGITVAGFRTGLQSYRMVLNSAASYSEYVHGGTAFQRGGFIYSNEGFRNRAFIDANIANWKTGNEEGQRFDLGSGKFGILPIPGSMFLKLPPGAGLGRRFHLRVRGQRANAFLYRAWNRTNDDLADGEMGRFANPVGFSVPPGTQKINFMSK
jgi:hypothetical protein